MISRIHNKLGTAGFIVAIVALVAALGGGAYAAQQGLNGKQKKQVKSIAQTEAKKFAGKEGPPGPPGAPGAPGAAGKDGTNGTNGADGDDGASVTGAPILAGGACGVGVTGVKYTLNETSTNVCNGKNGTNGTDGEDGVCSAANPECVIPPEGTLQGAWSAGLTSHDSFFAVLESISFGLLYDDEDPPTLKYVEEEGDFEAECPGTAEAPDAEPGFLCVYLNAGSNPSEAILNTALTTNNGLSNSGVTLFFQPKINEEEGVAQQMFVFGTWAVTAPPAGP